MGSSLNSLRLAVEHGFWRSRMAASPKLMILRRSTPQCYNLVKLALSPHSGHRQLATAHCFPATIDPVKPSIFVVEDDPDISRLVRHHLENDGFTVRVYPTGSNVLSDAERQRPALFVLDIMVPGKDGLELCRIVRQTPGLAAVPVIFLTAKSSEADRVLGLELGADDYIAKPFSPRELVARVKAVLRRFERPLPPSPMKIGEIEIDPSAMTLNVRGQLVPTTATEFRLLDYFARHTGRVFTRDHLLDSVWRDTSYVTPRSVDVYVRRIREKIEPDPENPRYLKTVRGAGYRFESPKQ
jgi:DNA-binding response OmpR family regulator